MRTGSCLTAFFLILLIGCTGKEVSVRQPVTTLCIIGTDHDSTMFVNPETMYQAIEKVSPDVILCELEAKFVKGNTYNLDEFPDLLSTNENISTYRYQRQYNIDLRPYEIEGRNDYYRNSSYFEKQQALFSEIMNAYQGKLLTDKSYQEWDCFLKTTELLDVSHNHTLEDLNSELYVCYSEAKDMILYNTLISVAKRDFPERHEDAKEFKRFWDKRNMAMAENIMKWCREYQGKVIVVLTGQQHKSQLLNLIQPQKDKYNIDIKEFWE